MAVTNKHHGTDGSITITPAAGADELSQFTLTDWRLSVVKETYDSTGFNSGQWRDKGEGLNSGSGSFTGFVDGLIDLTATMEAPDTAKAFVLQSKSSGGQVFSFNGVITGFDTGAAIGEVVTFSGSFETAGTITESET